LAAEQPIIIAATCRSRAQCLAYCASRPHSIHSYPLCLVQRFFYISNHKATSNLIHNLNVANSKPEHELDLAQQCVKKPRMCLSTFKWHAKSVARSRCQRQGFGITLAIYNILVLRLEKCLKK